MYFFEKETFPILSESTQLRWVALDFLMGLRSSQKVMVIRIMSASWKSGVPLERHAVPISYVHFQMEVD